MVDISIIIPTKNEEKNLFYLLEDIKKQSWVNKNKVLNYEIIVADANSEDKTRFIAENYNAKIVEGGLPGVGRNNGARIAKGNIIFTIDADIRIKNSNFFVSAYNEFTKRGLDCASVNNNPLIPESLPLLKKEAIKLIFEISNIFIRIVQYSHNPRAVGTCMIFKKETFLKIGGFNEGTYFGEDSEIAKRIVTEGYSFGVLNPTIFIETGIRRVLKKGIIKYCFDSIILDIYKNLKNETISKETYFKLTGLNNHFEK